jgi:hypothetical protein
MVEKISSDDADVFMKNDYYENPNLYRAIFH